MDPGMGWLLVVFGLAGKLCLVLFKVSQWRQTEQDGARNDQAGQGSNDRSSYLLPSSCWTHHAPTAALLPPLLGHDDAVRPAAPLSMDSTIAASTVAAKAAAAATSPPPWVKAVPVQPVQACALVSTTAVPKFVQPTLLPGHALQVARPVTATEPATATGARAQAAVDGTGAGSRRRWVGSHFKVGDTELPAPGPYTGNSLVGDNNDPWELWRFLDMVDAGQVSRVVFGGTDDEASRLLAGDVRGNFHLVEVLKDQSGSLIQMLRDHGVQMAVSALPLPDPGTNLAAAFHNAGVDLAYVYLPMADIAGVVALGVVGAYALVSGLFIIGESMSKGKDPIAELLEQTNSPLRILWSRRVNADIEPPEPEVAFDDVAGCDTSKAELAEVIDFLLSPERFQRVGATMPTGVLLEGPPGTGKTMLARAAAAEANVPFISVSGSEFVELFVGVGASRVRALFADARRVAPCIIFIDEIDAIGGKRSGAGSERGGGEREQTLNQILVEMDGFSKDDGVIVLAATNRVDTLDSALLRPGRFDRRICVGLPDLCGRRNVLAVHMRGKPLTSSVDGDAVLDSIAARTVGFSGADLANLVNEAAILAARREAEGISPTDFDDALTRISLGITVNGRRSDESRRLVALHEAGHAVMAALTSHYDKVESVSIMPRSSGANGHTAFRPDEARLESGLMSRAFLRAHLAVALGGRVAEELICGPENVTTGAANDLQQVFSVARRMVTQWGFASSDAMSGLATATAWDDDTAAASPLVFGAGRKPSPAARHRIDEAVSEIVADAFAMCYQTLDKHRVLVEKVADALVEEESISAERFESLVTAARASSPAVTSAAAAPEGVHDAAGLDE